MLRSSLWSRAGGPLIVAAAAWWLFSGPAMATASPATGKDSSVFPAASSIAGPASIATDDERLRGLVKPEKQVVLTAPLEGIIKEISAKEGQAVKNGQELIHLDDDLQQLTVKIAQLKAADDSDLKKAQLLLEESKIQLERIEGLHRDDAAREWEVRKARVQRDANIAAVEAATFAQKTAKQNLALEQKKLDRYTLRAPFDGRVLRIPLEEGATVNTNDQLITLVKIDKLDAELFLPVTLYGRLSEGKAYRLRAEAPVNKVLVGKLKVIEPVVDAASQTFRVVFEIDNPGEALPAGFNARLIWPQ